MLWLLLIIPALSLLCLVKVWRVEWWHFAAPFIGTAIIVGVAKASIERMQTSDIEYWTGYAVKAQYYEHWNELVARTETYTDANNNVQTRVVYDVVDHPPYWVVIDNNGIETGIYQSQFETLAHRWGNRSYHYMRHPSYTIDGNMYEAVWDNKDASLEVINSTHRYENRIIASHSVYKFPVVDNKDKATYHLFDYPAISDNYQCPSLLGDIGPETKKVDRQLQYLNARLGRSKQIRVWVLVFHEQPLDAAIAQQNYWQGGNKNELVICVGANKENEVQWSYVFSWTESELCKIETKDLITDQNKLDLSEVVTKLKPIIEEKWQRKHFKEFSYLSVDPPLWSILTTFLVVLVANGGFMGYVVSQNRG